MKLFSGYLVLLMLSSCLSKDNPYSNNSGLQSDTVDWPGTFHFGRVATKKEIDSINIDVSPDGTGLPRGLGTVPKGRLVYTAKCSVCHGKTGSEGPYNPLVSQRTDLHINEGGRTEKTVGNYWPYATTLYDYINRAMPYDRPGTLTAEEVYSVTAFLLNANNIIDSTTVLNANTLPEVAMPAQKLFIADDRKGGPEVK